MKKIFSKSLDTLSEFFAQRKGLLPILGILMICINFVLRIFGYGWLAETDLFLHLGLIIAIFGILLARVL